MNKSARCDTCLCVHGKNSMCPPFEVRPTGGASEKYLTMRQEIQRGQLCDCGARAVDKWRGEYKCGFCLNPPYDIGKAEDRLRAYSPTADCQNWADEDTDRTARQREHCRKWYKRKKAEKSV